MERRRIVRKESIIRFYNPLFKISNTGRYFVALIITLADGSRFFIFDHRPEVISLGNKLQEDESGEIKETFNQRAIVEIVERAGKQSINLYPSKNKESKTLFSQIIFGNSVKIKEDKSWWNLINKSSLENNRKETALISLTDEDHKIVISHDSKIGDMKIENLTIIGSDIKPGLSASETFL